MVGGRIGNDNLVSIYHIRVDSAVGIIGFFEKARFSRHFVTDLRFLQFSTEYVELKPTTMFPYFYIRCPCTDVSAPINGQYGPSNGSEEDEEQERTFDPKSPRANFSLYPLEHLQYCEDCHEIRCPRCIIEEIACWYCPSCLFELPSTIVKGDGCR